MKRVLLSIVVAVAATLVGLGAVPQPQASGVGAGDAVGVYLLKLKGSGFDRNANNGSVDQGKIRGHAVLTVSRADESADPRLVRVAITLEKNLRKSVLDRATPSPAALEGVGILVGDSLTVIGAGQPNFVNAVTLRFLKRGKRVEGWWMASFPGSDVDGGFVAGVGVSFRGKRLRATPAAPASVFAPRDASR